MSCSAPTCGRVRSARMGFFCLVSVPSGASSCKNAKVLDNAPLDDSALAAIAGAEPPDKAANTVSSSAITSAIDW